MDQHARRQKVRTLADDLAWLEEHCRRNPDLSVHSAHLRLAAALTRNVIGPAVDGQGSKPLFVAVVGGAGAGKSTVVNFLCGSVVADANPQAGFTRHPKAFVHPGLTAAWPSYLGFLGPLQRLSDDKPANLDEDVYQVKKLTASSAEDPFAEFAVWDCPDMTTWASTNYVSRLMEVVALADVVVYVASDERYNDEVPTQFLHLVIKAGKPVVCVLTKMREADAEPLTAHFRQQVLDKLPPSVGDLPTIPVVTIPHLPPDVRVDPAGKGAPYRVALLNQVLALAPTADDGRRRTLANAVRYLQAAGDGLLDVARRDLTELDTWRGVVTTGKTEFEERYRSEYLSGEAFRRFDQTREQVMHMLDLPGAGKFVSGVFGLVRWPYAFLRKFVVKAVSRPAPHSLSETDVCQSAMTAWLDRLQAESLRRAGQHPLWKQVVHGFDAGLKTQANDLFGQKLLTLSRKETDELDRLARAVPEKLAGNPLLLNVLRGGIILLDLVAIGLVCWAAWAMQSWWGLLLILPAVSITRHLVEFIVTGVVDRGRNKLKRERESMVGEQLTAPMQSWLGDWPTTGGSSLEKLQLVLRRVPDTIRELSVIVHPPVATTAPVRSEPASALG
jgi:GTPase SAR1 family protein